MKLQTLIVDGRRRSKLRLVRDEEVPRMLKRYIFVWGRVAVISKESTKKMLSKQNVE